MRRTIIESPYRGAVETNVAYARACVRDSLMRGEAPIASHLLLTQAGILDDNIPAERELGIAAGLAWQTAADVIAVYVDHGISDGMSLAVDRAKFYNIPVEYRSLYAVETAQPEASAA